MTVEYQSKQVIIIRKDLNMRKGKIAAQAAHASLAVILNLINWGSGDVGLWPEGGVTGEIDLTFDEQFHSKEYVKETKGICAWLFGSFAKIVCYVNSEEELVEIYLKANDANLPCSMITDAGNTEFNGVPTKTAVAIGPAANEDIDKITGLLPLL
jgi:PTH2 family peptidyl-tRNA hydrolase